MLTLKRWQDVYVDPPGLVGNAGSDHRRGVKWEAWIQGFGTLAFH